jgi:predicted DNA-binding ribbon-helix-helix protein
MALFGNLERRHIWRGENRTSIALEPQFWQAADRLAQGNCITWTEWAEEQLSGKPDDIGRASWLRVAILEAALKVVADNSIKTA